MYRHICIISRVKNAQRVFPLVCQPEQDMLVSLTSFSKNTHSHPLLYQFAVRVR